MLMSSNVSSLQLVNMGGYFYNMTTFFYHGLIAE